jgi:peptidoglycan hydrolase CwlO-like protein
MIKFYKLNKRVFIKTIILMILTPFLMGLVPPKADFFVFAEILADLNTQEAEAEAELEDLESKISQYRDAINQNQQKAKSLKTEIAIFDDEIESLQLELQRTELLAKKLDNQINSKEKSIREIEKEFDLEKATLAELAREMRKYDDRSFLEVLLNKDSFSEFISELKLLEDFNISVQEELKKIAKAKTGLEKEKEDLVNKKDELVSLKKIQDQQRIEVERKKEERKNLLGQTRGQENLFNQLLKKAQSDIEAIKNKLYFLEGLIADGALRFEDAYKYAKYAGTYTGIRPAFLLAILSRESELGKNIGKGSWRIDMKPSQRTYYLQVCRELEIDPDKYPVSKKAWYGWGGAMGPAQMLPATWLMYSVEITEITGNDPPSPWNVKDAFVASALYLADKGAIEQTKDAEWKAAMMYLAGANWQKASLRFYGDQVMETVKHFQEQIDILEGK